MSTTASTCLVSHRREGDSVVMDMRPGARRDLQLMLVPALFALIMLAVRLYRLDVPFERDEGEYAYIAQMMLRGEAPYSEAYTMKLPGVPLWYAVFFLIFGETVRSAHIAGFVADIISATAIGVLCRPLVVDERLRRALPFAAAAFFICLASLLRFDGFMANCEKFVVTSVTTSLAVFVHARDRRGLALAGVVMGTAFVCKQQALPFLALLGLATLLRERDARLLRRGIDGVVVAAGMLVPYVVVVVVLAAWDGLDAFWFQTVQYASKYVGVAKYPMRYLAKALEHLIREPLVVFAVVGLVVVAVSRTFAPRSRVMLLATFVASVAALSIGLFFRGHYFFLALPVLAIAAGTLATVRPFMIVPTALMLLGSTAMHRDVFWEKSDDDVNADHYHQTTFIRAAHVAQLLKAATAPDERVLIIGNEPEVLFMADRRSITPYIYFYPLLEPQPYAPRQRQEVIDATAAARPEYVVMHLTTIRRLKSKKHNLQAWAFDLMKEYEIVWPAEPSPVFDAALVERTNEPLYLMRRKHPADDATLNDHPLPSSP